METKKISSTFSHKSDASLSSIIQRYNLKNDDITILSLTRYSMYFARQEIVEKELVDLIQKNLNLSQKTAEDITKELKEKLIPTLWDKMPAEERERLLNEVKKELSMGRIPNSAVKPVLPPSITQEANRSYSTARENPQTNSVSVPAPVKRSQRNTNDNLMNKPLSPQKPKPTTPDKYRETPT